MVHIKTSACMFPLLLIMIGLLFMLFSKTPVYNDSSSQAWPAHIHMKKPVNVSHKHKNNKKINDWIKPSGVSHVHLYEPSQLDAINTFECLWMLSDPPAPVCIHDPTIDTVISKSLKTSKKWEDRDVHILQEVLKTDPDMVFIDCGANIGVYSLSAAAMGRHVIAVEPFIENLMRFYKAVSIGHYEELVLLIHNILSFTHKTEVIKIDKSNIGGSSVVRPDPKTKGHNVDCGPNELCVQLPTITLDDLAPYFPARNAKAVMKMDIEGSEHVAFMNASALFDRVYIPVVMMEWEMEKRILQSDQSKSSESASQVHALVDFFFSRGYGVFSVGDRWDEFHMLSRKSVLHWPWNIVFIHKSFQENWTYMHTKKEK